MFLWSHLIENIASQTRTEATYIWDSMLHRLYTVAGHLQNNCRPVQLIISSLRYKTFLQIACGHDRFIASKIIKIFLSPTNFFYFQSKKTYLLRISQQFFLLFVTFANRKKKTYPSHTLIQYLLIDICYYSIYKHSSMAWLFLNTRKLNEIMLKAF